MRPHHFSKKIIAVLVFLFFLALYFFFSYTHKVEYPDYGVSFNTMYAEELGLNWKEVYDAFLDDLGVKRVRLAAHWTMVEPQQGEFSFTELDYQIRKAEQKDVEIIFAVGKRLPRWPECHVPEWAKGLNKQQQEEKILLYIEEIVNRYKSSDAIIVWQVENEPFLSSYAKTHCINFDEDFLKKEIALVKSLDEKNRPILITDSGELSTWRKTFGLGDMFGTTLYVYSFNSVLGEFRNPFLPGFYMFRSNLWKFLGSDNEAIIAELSLEPWLDKPIIDEQLSVQIERMSPEKFDTVIQFAKQTGMKTQYLWGAEWWYYMKLQGNEWYWNKGKELFFDR